MLYLLDTNILVFLIVGLTETRLIGSHKNTTTYLPEHLSLLADLLGPNPQIITTPNVATETSNLLAQTNQADRKRIMDVFQAFLQKNAEFFVDSKTASARSDFRWRGVTDCAIIELTRPAYHLITGDHLLYQHFSKAGRLTTNFRHVIDRAGL